MIQPVRLGVIRAARRPAGRRRSATFLLLVILAGGPVAPAAAQPHPEKPSVGSSQANKAKSLPAVPPAREAEALEFVRQHAPELERLLVYLEQHRPREYQRALRDLLRSRDRITPLRERDPRRYPLELRAWQLKSHIELLAARARMSDDSVLRDELRTALRDQLALRRELLVYEQQRLSDRLQKIQEQVSQLDERGEEELARQFRLLTEPPRGAKKKR